MALITGVQNGSWIGLQVGGVILGGQTSLSHDASVDEIEVTTKNSAKHHKTFIAGELGETLSVEGLCEIVGGTPAYNTSAYLTAYKAMGDRAEVEFDIFQSIEMGAATPSTTVLGSGKGIITAVNNANPQNDKSTTSITIRINEYTPATLV